MSIRVDLGRYYGEVTGWQWLVTIDGRQALAEGPRRVGHCVYCAGPCEGQTLSCEERVWTEANSVGRQ